MSVKVKSAADVAAKWARVASTRGSDYEAGAVGAGADWEKNASAAGKAFQAAVTAGNIGQMFVGGVKKAGGAKYDRKVKDVGVARYSTGINAAVTDMQNGIAPMLDTIASLTLTPRAPRGSESNLTRVREIAVALNKKRMALRAAGA